MLPAPVSCPATHRIAFAHDPRWDHQFPLNDNIAVVPTMPSRPPLPNVLPTPPQLPKMPSKTSSTRLFSGTSELDLQTAATLLRTEHTIAFPTETVYGLGANAFSPSAIQKIFTAKQRPSDNPLIVHISSPGDLHTHSLTTTPSTLANTLITEFWPGPLTLILPLHPRTRLAKSVTAGLSTVAVRLPRHPVACALLAKAGVPVAAPSANLSGRPSPTCVEHVMRDLKGRIDGIVDGDIPDVGVESTVVDVSNPSNPEILRVGAVTKGMIEAVTGVSFRQGGLVDGVARAPGMKYRHYAPRARVRVCEIGDVGKVVGGVEGRVGVLCEDGAWEGECVVRLGKGAEEYARGLYAGLRKLDDMDVDTIIAVLPNDLSGVGEAVAERLYKAAGGGKC